MTNASDILASVRNNYLTLRSKIAHNVINEGTEDPLSLDTILDALVRYDDDFGALKLSIAVQEERIEKFKLLVDKLSTENERLKKTIIELSQMLVDERKGEHHDPDSE